MIVKMQKAFIVSRRDQRQALLETLADMGVLHVVPVDPGKAVASEQLVARLERTERAIQILSNTEPAGEPPDDLSPQEIVDETLAIQQRTADAHSRLSMLYRQIEQLAMWGETRLEQFRDLSEAGVHVVFVAVGYDKLDTLDAQLVKQVSHLSDGRAVMVMVSTDSVPDVPDHAERIELPEQDRPTLRDQARRLDEQLKADAARQARLATRVDDLRATADDLLSNVKLSLAEQSGIDDGPLFAVQGWVPEDSAHAVADELASRGVQAACTAQPPDPDEQPPTLIRYPRWARTIKGLFDVLGTLPGYREYDLSGFFMIAMPIFAAMLIGDAGYGLIFLLLGAVFYRKIVASGSREQANLIMVFGAVTLIWGILTANYFGISPQSLAQAAGYTQIQGGIERGNVPAMMAADGGGLAGTVGRTMHRIAPLYRANEQRALSLMIVISFVIGTVHLVSARLRQAIGLAPDIRALAPIGWSVFLIGMLGLILGLFSQNLPIPALMPMSIVPGLLIAGAVLVVLFTAGSFNPIKIIGRGLVANLLDFVGTFSDTMSYLRLMAVGMASYYIAFSFNLLASQLADATTWAIAWPLLVFGHGMNISLGIIAIFAHGMRLNMLEFSNNVGVQWAGYPYRPFAKTRRTQE